jgi:hypothetical protein
MVYLSDDNSINQYNRAAAGRGEVMVVRET